ncbi:MAG: hypothetical protein V1873_04640 [Verrucomicrobiota bacterium]
MMKVAVWSVVIVLLAVAGLAWFVATHHLILTEKGAVLVGKRFLTYEETYADTRSWSITDFDEHPNVRDALIRNGYGDIISELRREELDRSVKQLAADAEAQVQELMQAVMRRITDWLGEMEKNMSRTGSPAQVSRPATAAPKPAALTPRPAPAKTSAGSQPTTAAKP